MTLTPGHYVVTIGDNYESLPFSFRLLDISTATPISIGSVAATPVTVTLNPANATQLYSFTGTAGQKLFFNNPAGQPNVTYRIIDPNGALFEGPNYVNNNTGAVTLTVTGTYLLEMEGGFGNTGSTSFQFQLIDASDQLGALTLGQAFTGTVAQPGQRDIHSFTLTQATVVYADALTNDGNLTWSLTGPAGQVDIRNFTGTDGVNRSGTDAVGFLLQPGTYNFIVTRASNGTGAYGFNLLNLAQATPLTLGVSTPIALTPANSTNAYAISANAGDQLHLSVLGGSYVSLRLLDASGRLISFLYTGSDGITTPPLAATGIYTLLVEGYVADGDPSQSLTLRADEVANPTQATTLGAQIDATIATPGQTASYTFDVASARNVLIDPLGYDGRFSYTLTYPDGTTVSHTFDNAITYYVGYYSPSNPLQLLARRPLHPHHLGQPERDRHGVAAPDRRDRLRPR